MSTNAERGDSLFQTTTSNNIVDLTPAGVEEIGKYKNVYTDSSKPVLSKDRDWTSWNFAALWIGMLISIPVYMVASGLIVEGMTWYQSLFTICLGHTIVMIPAVLIGHAGTKFGINFPMLSRSVLGAKGAGLSAIIRAILGCFWFGVQCWIGGEALHAIFKTISPSWMELGFTGYFITFMIFWLLNLYVTYTGSKGVKIMENVAAPILIFLALCVVVWSHSVCGGFAGMLTISEISGAGTDFWKLFFPALSAMIAFDGAIAVSMPDFTRHAVKQKDQFVGQVVAAPVMVVFIAFVGVAGTAGSVKAFGRAIWNPSELVAQFDSPFIVILFSLFIIAAVLTTNVAANLVPPANVFSTIFHKVFSYKTAAVFSAILGLLVRPWAVLSGASTLIFEVCGTLGALLGPIAGIYMASYWLEHRAKLKVVDLYRADGGAYWYTNGWNVGGVVIFAVCSVLMVIGKWWSPMQVVFDNSYVIGMIGTGLIYYLYLKTKAKNTQA